MGRIGRKEHPVPGLDHLLTATVVDVRRRQHADAGMPVLMVVPAHEPAAGGTAVLDGTEALGKLGPVLEGLELRLRERVVVALTG